MPLEVKPLFRPDVLRKHLQYFNLPASVKDLRPECSSMGKQLRRRGS
jgi:hypothetical protein